MENQVKSDYLVCEICGSRDVQVKAWIDPNTNEICDECWGDKEDCWCCDCQENVYLTFESEWIKHVNEDDIETE